MENETVSRPRPSLFNLRQLTLVEWFLSAPEGSRRFLVENGKTLKFFETGAVRPDGKFAVSGIVDGENSTAARLLANEFGGRIRVQPYDLVEYGILSYHPTRYPNMAADAVSMAEKVADIHIDGNWSHNSACYEIAADWVGDWYFGAPSERRAKLLSKAREKDAATHRRAVFGRTWRVEPRVPENLASMLPDGYRLELPSQSVVRPCVVATVVGETEKRFKVVDVRPINGNPTTWLGLRIGKDDFIEREYLMLDDVDEADIAKLSAFDAEYAAEIEAISLAAYEEIVPIIARMGNRLLQKKGQQADMLSELVASLAAAKNR